MKKIMELAQALPYIMKFHGKVVVVKYGGNAMGDPQMREKVIMDIALLKYLGMKPVVVHGGGPEIDRMLERLGKKASFNMGNRVTDWETMEIVEMVLGGKVNKELVSLLNKNGIRGVGITGKDSNLISARKKYVHSDEGRIDIGHVGEVEGIDPKIVEEMLEIGVVPVIAPLGTDREGNTYNINADYVAGEMAGALRAERLILMTDTDGIYIDFNDKGSLIRRISEEEGRNLLNEGVVAGGMIPKVETCLNALGKGVERVHIVNGRREHSVLAEIFTEDGMGTMFVRGGDRVADGYLQKT